MKHYLFREIWMLFFRNLLIFLFYVYITHLLLLLFITRNDDASNYKKHICIAAIFASCILFVIIYLWNKKRRHNYINLFSDRKCHILKYAYKSPNHILWFYFCGNKLFFMNIKFITNWNNECDLPVENDF